MYNGNLPPSGYSPDDVEDRAEATFGGLEMHRLAEWGQGECAQLHDLYSEGNADDGAAQDESEQEVPQCRDKSSEHKPDDIAQQTHCYLFLRKM